jgi:hypothetical protein
MMNKELSNVCGLTSLSRNELMSITGGSADGTPSTPTSFWNDAGYFLGVVAKGFIVFGTEGGRNAGLVVK